MKLQRYKYLLTFVSILILQGQLLAQDKASAETWHGFKKQSFKVDTASAYIVVPEKPMPGNPWLWRTYSPEFHVEIDSILVTKGFHIGFININNKALWSTRFDEDLGPILSGFGQRKKTFYQACALWGC